MKTKTKLTPQIAGMYLGCEAKTIYGKMILIKIDVNRECLLEDKQTLVIQMFFLSDIKLILRSLEDITEEDIKKLCSFNSKIRLSCLYDKGVREDNMEYMTPKDFKYLLEKHYDLFGLIASGCAIRKQN